MASEKTPSLYIPTNEGEEKMSEKKPKMRYCPKYFLSWVLAALLIALIVALCVQFAVPTYEHQVIDEVHIFQGKPVGVPKKSKEKAHVNSAWHLDFLINPTRLCYTRDSPDSEAYQKNPEIKLLVLAPSAISHFERRNTIRNTWGSVAQKPHSPVRVGFVLGTTTNSTEQDLIKEESVRFGDIIQADFEDTYRNLTTKSMLMLKWISAHCAHAEYFLKTDDDTFVNMDVVSRLVRKPAFASQDKFIGGYVHKGAQPSRNPNEKYYVSEDDYPEKEYPPYASGSAYLTTGPTAQQLFDATRRVKPIVPMEDVFITGLCADDIDASLVHDPAFQYTTIISDPISWNDYSNLATAHSVNPDDMDVLFNLMTKSLGDNIALLEGEFGESDQDGSLDSAIFDVLDLLGMRPVSSMSVSISNSDSFPSSSLEKLFNFPPRNLPLFPPYPSPAPLVKDVKLDNQRKTNRMSPQGMPFESSPFALFNKAMDDMQRDMDMMVKKFDGPDWADIGRESVFLPGFPFLPFNVNNAKKPLVNMTVVAF